ncbi:MAG: DNA replication and repair protein RecF [Pseudomonadales bacterium]
MTVAEFRLQNFRNISEAAISLGDGVNLFVGDNGAGKTSILEAIHVVARGRSFRAADSAALCREGMPGYAIGLTVTTPNQDPETLLLRRTGQHQEILLNHQRCHRQSDLARRLPIQLVTPDVGELVTGSPGVRRQFLDWGLFHVKHNYHVNLRRYMAALKQRNAWLRAVDPRRLPEVDPWAPQLSIFAQEIHAARDHYCEALFPAVQRYAMALGLELEVDIRYGRGWSTEYSEDLADILGEQVAGDVKFGGTRAGPHRADLFVKSRSRSAGATLSRGQAKVLALAFHLAQVDILRRLSGITSIVLFDELVAELDSQRCIKVLDALESSQSQVLITAVQLPDDRLVKNRTNLRMFHVKHGEVVND